MVIRPKSGKLTARSPEQASTARHRAGGSPTLCDSSVVEGALQIHDQNIAEMASIEMTGFELVPRTDGAAAGRWRLMDVVVEGIIDPATIPGPNCG